VTWDGRGRTPHRQHRSWQERLFSLPKFSQRQVQRARRAAQNKKFFAAKPHKYSVQRAFHEVKCLNEHFFKNLKVSTKISAVKKSPNTPRLKINFKAPRKPVDPSQKFFE